MALHAVGHSDCALLPWPGSRPEGGPPEQVLNCPLGQIHPDLPRLVLAGRTVARPAHTVDDSAGRRTDVPGKSKA